MRSSVAAACSANESSVEMSGAPDSHHRIGARVKPQGAKDELAIAVGAVSGDAVIIQEHEAHLAARKLFQVAIEEDAEGLSASLKHRWGWRALRGRHVRILEVRFLEKSRARSRRSRH